MRKGNLIQEITQNIYENSEQSITGQILQDTLLNMAETVFDEIDEKINNIIEIPEFSGIIDVDVPVNTGQTITDTSGGVIFCSPKKAFVYKLGLTYYKYWYSWRNYNIETSDTYEALPNKVFNLVSEAKSTQYVFNDTTKNLIPLRSFEVTSELGDSPNIAMSQAKITDLYNEGYKFSHFVSPGDILPVEASRKKFFVITSAPGIYKLPIIIDDDGSAIWQDTDIPGGTILVYDENGVDLAAPIRRSQFQKVISCSTRPEFDVSGTIISITITDITEIDYTGLRLAIQTFKKKLSISLDGWPRALIVRNSIPDKTGELKIVDWPALETSSDIPLLITDGQDIVGGALFGYYAAWKLSEASNKQGKFVTIDSNDGMVSMSLDSYAVLDLIDTMAASVRIKVPDYAPEKGGVIKLLILNKTGSSISISSVIYLRSISVNMQPLSNSLAAIPNNNVGLLTIFITPARTGEKNGRAYIKIEVGPLG